MKTIRFALAAGLLFGITARASTIINISSAYGFTYDGGGSDPEPQPGQHLNLIGSPLISTDPWTRNLPDHQRGRSAGRSLQRLELQPVLEFVGLGFRDGR